MKLRDWVDKDKLNWNFLSLNPNAIELLKENPDKINWYRLCLNENPNVIKILKENKDKIDWCCLSENPNPKLIELFQENPSEIKWTYLCKNPNAIELLKENRDKINWYYLSENPSIFTYDYETIKNKNKDLNEAVVFKALHPKRMLRLMEEYGEDEIYNCYFNDE